MPLLTNPALGRFLGSTPTDSDLSRIQPGKSKSADILVENTMAGAVAQIANNLSDILADCLVFYSRDPKGSNEAMQEVLANIDAVLNNKANNFEGVDLERITSLRNQVDALLKGSHTSVKQFLVQDGEAYESVLKNAAMPTHVMNREKKLVKLEDLPRKLEEEGPFDPRDLFRRERVNREASLERDGASTPEPPTKLDPNCGARYSNPHLTDRPTYSAPVTRRPFVSRKDLQPKFTMDEVHEKCASHAVLVSELKRTEAYPGENDRMIEFLTKTFDEAIARRMISRR